MHTKEQRMSGEKTVDDITFRIRHTMMLVSDLDRSIDFWSRTGERNASVVRPRRLIRLRPDQAQSKSEGGRCQIYDRTAVEPTRQSRPRGIHPGPRRIYFGAYRAPLEKWTAATPSLITIATSI